MATSTITVAGINPGLNILGPTQQLNFNQNLSTLQINNTYIPTSLISSQTNLEFRNFISDGFRWYHVTSDTDTYGSLTLQTFVNAEASGSGSDVMKFDSNGVEIYTPLSMNGQIISNGIWEGATIGLAYGGTNANLTASNGGIFYSTASAGAILAGSATANQTLLSGASGAPSWSTTTYPVTTTINQILYSSSNNTIAGLATANNGVVITSGSGVPSVSSTIPSATQANITTVGTIGTGTWNGTPITVTYGGTGNNSATAYSVICGGTTSTGVLQSVSGLGNSGQVLTSQGANALPSWANAGSGTVTSIIAGTGLTGGTITTSGTIAINSSVVTATSSGGAATAGLGTLNGTTGVTIATTAVTTSSVVNITRNNGASGAPLASSLGELSVGSIIANTSFTTYSSNALDIFGFSWQIVNPA